MGGRRRLSPIFFKNRKAFYGILVEDKQNGYCIVKHYFGNFEISKDTLFETKEDCEKFILTGEKNESIC